ncbi:MAG: alcohol dehydrogenase catalytic domain-containing protein [Actinomycetota bacterium]|nr:alcohol dehydrogenase catalytic domain-containing protein [Actinomycetota bacterium]MEC9395311.1 alcohol dehydrogenase catalytic domain-containing protein [Actinomycetota bacterium]MED6328818.1 alcohol dehydrogenase catalytic domain-containing protein [Actinomycetota bacterium]
MKAVELQAFGQPLVVVDRPAPTIGDGEHLVDVTACGVCHSDLHVVDGQWNSPLPLVLGHEVTGDHAELGPVMVYAPWGCRACWTCETGHEMVCPDAVEAGVISDGGYAEQMRVPHREYLQPLGDLDPVRAAPLACAGLTAFRATRQTLEALRRRGPVARALVIGAGGLGQFGIQFLKLLTDAEVTVADLSVDKRTRAIELGADQAVTPDELDCHFDAIVDFVGAQPTLETAVQHVNRRGMVVAVGLFGGRVPFGIGAVPHEAQFMSSVWGTVAELGELIGFAHDHPLDFTVETAPLEEAEAAHQRLRSGEASGRMVLTT